MLLGGIFHFHDNTINEDQEAIIKLLNDMKTTECAILHDVDYLEKYYPLIDRLKNRGGLTLISPKYIELGHEILVTTSVNVDMAKISKLKDERSFCVFLCQLARLFGFVFQTPRLFQVKPMEFSLFRLSSRMVFALRCLVTQCASCLFVLSAVKPIL